MSLSLKPKGCYNMTRRKTFLFFYFIFLLSWVGLANPSPQTDFLLTPTDGETGISIEPTFTWTPQGGATSYTIRISTAGGVNFDAGVIYTQTSITTANVNLTGVIPIPLSNNHLYYWQVQAYRPSPLPDLISQIWSFQTYSNVNITLLNPGSGTTVFPTDVLFSYYLNVASIGFDYKLQVIAAESQPTAGDWLTPDFSPPAVPDLAQTISELAGGTKYYWRIVLLEEGAIPIKVLKYSSVRYFKTSGGAVKPIPSYPLSGTIYTNTPTLYWYLPGFSTDLTFEIEVEEDVSGATKTYPLVGDPDIEDLYFEIPEGDCDPGTKYYWRVRSVYTPPSGGTIAYSNFSDWKNFTTHGTGTVLKPTCSYPKGNTTVYTTLPTLYWYVGGSSEGLTFDVEIVNTSTSQLTSLTAEELSVQLVAALTPGTTYKWRVCSKNSTGTSSLWSDWAFFKVTGGTANTHTVVTYPKNYTTLYTKKPTLWWYLEGADFGVTGYKLQYKLQGGGWEDLAVVDGAENTSYEFPEVNGLLANQKYDWQVAAIHNGAPGVYTYSAGGFKIVAGSQPGVPVLTYPKNTTVYTASPTLFWYVNGSTTNVTGYNVMYSYSSEFTPTTTVTDDTPDQFYLCENLHDGYTYWWKVQLIVNDVPYGDYSQPQKFYVKPGSNAPSSPIVGGPDNISVTTTSPTISWAVPADPPIGATYDLEIADNPDFTNSVSMENLVNQNHDVQGLTVNRGYFWRVRMKDGQGNYSNYSPTAQFMVVSPTGVENETIPSEFNLDQNYPNPFNPSTTIRFNLPEDVNVKLVVFNSLGEQVSQLINGQMEAGTYSIKFDANTLPTGIYFYRIEAGSFTAIRKMILLK